MLKIRLQRYGSKHAPTYRMVVAPSRAPRDGRFVEQLGHYNPKTKEKSFRLDRVDHWVSKGAQFTETARNLVKAFRSGKGAMTSAKPKATESAASDQAGVQVSAPAASA